MSGLHEFGFGFSLRVIEAVIPAALAWCLAIGLLVLLVKIVGNRHQLAPGNFARRLWCSIELVLGRWSRCETQWLNVTLIGRALATHAGEHVFVVKGRLSDDAYWRLTDQKIQGFDDV